MGFTAVSQSLVVWFEKKCDTVEFNEFLRPIRWIELIIGTQFWGFGFPLWGPRRLWDWVLRPLKGTPTTSPQIIGPRSYLRACNLDVLCRLHCRLHTERKVSDQWITIQIVEKTTFSIPSLGKKRWDFCLRVYIVRRLDDRHTHTDRQTPDDSNSPLTASRGQL